MIKIFTDGACSGNPGPGGWAYIICKDEEIMQNSGGGDKRTTNNRMELMAVVKALTEVLRLNDKHFQILSDSAYVINAINNHWIGCWNQNGWKTSKGDDVKNSDLWKTLIEIKNECKEQGKVLMFEKIKGHSGNYFNEWVDSMAKNEVNKQARCLR